MVDQLNALGVNGRVPANTAPVANKPATAEQAALVAPPPRQFDPAAVKLAASEINQYLKSIDRQIEFNVDRETGNTVIKITDTGTGQVLRQIPSEAMLAIMHDLDKLRGLLIHAQV